MEMRNEGRGGAWTSSIIFQEIILNSLLLAAVGLIVKLIGKQRILSTTPFEEQLLHK